ncbi:hypothetical protein ACFLTM_00305 [Candidatus Bipolaricaulota bacterium]
MGWRTVVTLGLSCLLGLGGLVLGSETGDETVRFALGGSPAIGVLHLDVEEINGFVSGAGFGRLSEYVFMNGDGGRGRIGAIGGLSIGGIGWGAEVSATGDAGVARLALGFGGLELGRVIGGSRRSMLTLGVVLGGGGASLVLTEGGASGEGGCRSIDGRGIVPEPIVVAAHRGLAAVMPFLSMQVQPLRFAGFELHVGYLLPVFGAQWGDPAVADHVSLELSGPAVGISFTWGWVGRSRRRAFEETIERSVPLVGHCVEVENQVGGIAITGAESPAVQTGSSALVEIVAVKRARSRAALDDIRVSIEETECGLRVRTETSPGDRGAVDYAIRVPEGTKLSVDQGAGDVSLLDFRGSAAISLGVGKAEIRSFAGPELSVEAGVGSIVLVDVEAETTSVDIGVGGVVLVDVASDQVIVEAGVGGIEVVLSPWVSYTVTADVGIGEASVGPFPGVGELRSGGLGGDLEAVVGDGDGTLTLSTGIGSIEVGGMED